MLNIIYWNLHKRKIEEYIVNCIVENDVDIAIFSEFENVDFQSVICNLGNTYQHIKAVEEDKKVTMIVRRGIRVTSMQPQKRYTIYTVDTCLKKYIVAALHLEDRRNYKPAQRIDTIQTIVPDIEENERCNDCDNTIVIGDFNANPYDEEMLSKYGFNAVLFKSVINDEEYTNPKSNRIRRFYNPILHYLSEETEMYGSFYFDDDYMTPYWYCLDQILVRRKLANCIANIKYLKSINNIGLIKGKSPDNRISDHLPLLVNIVEVNSDE